MLAAGRLAASFPDLVNSMKKVLVLGATGQIAHWVIQFLADDPEVQLTLFARNMKKMKANIPQTAVVYEGDVLDEQELRQVMAGQDIVYANLAGAVDEQAAHIVAAMKKSDVHKLIFITSLGIYQEIPGKFGEWNQRKIGKYLMAYRKAADIIEASGLDYSILRPAWLTNADEVDYQTTQKTEPFRGTIVARKSVAALVVELIQSSDRWQQNNLGINKPDTDANRPSLLRFFSGIKLW